MPRSERGKAKKIAQRLKETSAPRAISVKKQTSNQYSLIGIPASMQGTWYSFDVDGKMQTLNISEHGVNGQAIYHVPDLFSGRYGTSIPSLGSHLVGTWQNGSLGYLPADCLQTDTTGFNLGTVDGQTTLI